MRNKILAALAAIVVIAAVVVFFVVRSLDDQTQTKAADVMGEFRAAAKPAKDPRPGLPAQGVYEYRVTGKEKIQKALTIERTLPPTAAMIVLHTDAGYDTDTRYSGEHREQARYALGTEGATLTFAITTIAAGPIKTVRDRAWNPVLLRFPADGTLPGSVSGDYTAGDLKLKVTATNLPDETVEVDGTPVKAKVYKFAQDVTGEYSGNRTETFWYDPKSALVLRYVIRSSIKGPTNLDFDVDQTLVSLTPRT